MTPIDRKYYKQRAATERVIAAETVDRKIADLHNNLADLYEQFLALDSSGPDLRIVGDVSSPGLPR